MNSRNVDGFASWTYLIATLAGLDRAVCRIEFFET